MEKQKGQNVEKRKRGTEQTFNSGKKKMKERDGADFQFREKKRKKGTEQTFNSEKKK